MLETIRDAPSATGVYFFFGEGRRLLYVGKAVNLRSRLMGYTGKPRHPRTARLVAATRDVRWQVCPDENTALVREADVIQSLRPPYNVAQAYAAEYRFVVMTRVSEGRDGVRVQLDLTPAAEARGGIPYGCFPHLAKGKGFFAANQAKLGYNALLRLLHATGRGRQAFRLPGKICGPSPPLNIQMTTSAVRLRPLHDLFTGRSDRLINELRTAVAVGDVPEYMRPALARDVEAARSFYTYGPFALASLRRRHGLRSHLVPGERFDELVRAEVAGVVGEFVVPRRRRRRRGAAVPAGATSSRV